MVSFFLKVAPVFGTTWKIRFGNLQKEQGSNSKKALGYVVAWLAQLCQAHKRGYYYCEFRPLCLSCLRELPWLEGEGLYTILCGWFSKLGSLLLSF